MIWIHTVVAQIDFSKIFIHKHSVKQFESRSGQTFCRIDLGLNCLKGYQQITKVAAGNERVKRWSSVDLIRKFIVTKISDIEIDWKLLLITILTVYSHYLLTILQQPQACADPGIFARGGTGTTARKQQLWQCFFLVLNLFYSFTVVYLKENYNFPRFQRGSNIFQGGPSFSRGGPTFSRGRSKCWFV